MMSRIITKLIRDSIIVRNCTILQKYNVIQSHVYFSQDALACRTNEIGKVNSLRMIDQIKNIIENTRLDSERIRLEDALKIVYKLEDTFKGKRIDYEEWKNIEDITCLFEIINKNVNMLHMYEIIRILKILVMWNVPHDITLVQALLQLIRTRVNDLSTGQIIILQHILHNMKQCPLTNSLNIALYKLLKENAKIELNTNNFSLKAASNLVSLTYNKKYINRFIRTLALKPYKLHISNVVPIYAMLYNTPETMETKQFLFRVRKLIKDNCNELTVDEITSILQYICKSCLNNTMKLYDENLIFLLYSTVIKKDITFQKIINILNYLNMMRHSCVELLNYLAKTCNQSTDIIDKSSFEDINVLITGFVIADHKPNGWGHLKTMLGDYVTKTDHSLPQTISISFSLLSLDCYYPKLLEKIFTLYNKLTITSNEITLDILKLYWCVKLLYPASDDILLDENKLNEVKIRPKEGHISCLMESLKEVCGSDKYMKSGLKTKWGLLIDNIVVKQPDGSLMDISSYDNITFIEELASLSECDKIIFVALKKEQYSINMKNMLSTVRIQLKAIEQLPRYRVFVVDPFSWKTFSHEKKVAHLQEAIKKNYSNISDV